MNEDIKCINGECEVREDCGRFDLTTKTVPVYSPVDTVNCSLFTDKG
jgi:hypothetical protein